jgi:hypothetical protein
VYPLRYNCKGWKFRRYKDALVSVNSRECGGVKG